MNGMDKRTGKESQSLALNLHNLRQQNPSARRTLTIPTQDNYMLLSPKAMLATTTPQGVTGFELLGTSALSSAQLNLAEGINATMPPDNN